MTAGRRSVGGYRVRRAGGGLAAGALLWAAAPALAASPQIAISLSPVSGEIRSGDTVGLTGALSLGDRVAQAGATVELEADPFPYRGFFDAGHRTTGPDGHFAFEGLRPDRNTHYRVRGNGRVSHPVAVHVDAPGVLHSYDRGPGRAVLTMLSLHSGYFRWTRVPVYWYLALPGSPSFHLAAVTRTRELKPGVTFATATVDPPAARFVFLVCFNGAGEGGVGLPGDHRRCPRGDFRSRPPARR